MPRLWFVYLLAASLGGQDRGERQTLLAGLDRTEQLVRDQVAQLSPEQWSLTEIVEHLGLQEDMYFREIYLIAQ